MNEELQFFQGLFNSGTQNINLALLGIQIILTSILCYIISIFYVRYGNSLSNRKALSKNFVLIGLTTMIIITIVKSSLALSLGLVGALSIVRFRTAIKEPEELAFFFIVISIGLGIGAEQLMVTLMGTIAICVIVFLNNKSVAADITQNLVIRMPNSEKQRTEEIVEQLKNHCTSLELRRLDDAGESMEMSFAVSFKNLTGLMGVKDYLKTNHPLASFSFMQRV